MNNKMSMQSRVVLILLVAVMATSCSSLARQAPSRINFTGVWNISHEMSGDPSTLPGLVDAKPSTNGGDDVASDVFAQVSSQHLRIHQTDTATTITYDGGVKKTYDWGKFGYRKARSGWEDNHFVIRRPGPGGHLLIRRYILSDGGDSMTVVTVFNKMAMTQFYELDKDATKKAFGKLVSLPSDNP